LASAPVGCDAPQWRRALGATQLAPQWPAHPRTP